MTDPPWGSLLGNADPECAPRFQEWQKRLWRPFVACWDFPAYANPMPRFAAVGRNLQPVIQRGVTDT